MTRDPADRPPDPLGTTSRSADAPASGDPSPLAPAPAVPPGVTAPAPIAGADAVAPEGAASPGVAAPTEARRWRRWLRRFTAATPPEVDRYDPLADEPASPRSNLLDKSPFAIGFFATLGGLLAFALVATLGALQWVLLLVILALYLALGLNPGVEWLHRHGVPRPMAVTLVALLLVAFIVLGAWAVLPVVTQQVNALAQNMPSYLEDLRANGAFADIDARFGIVDRISETVLSGAWIEGVFGGLLGAGLAIANVVVSLVITLVLTLYFLASLPAIKAAIYELAPASKRPRVRYLANQVFVRIGGYIRGLFIVVGCATLAAFLFLNIVGLGSLSLALAVVVMVCAFIPIVGPSTSMVIVSIVAYSVSPAIGLATLVFFLIYLQVDAYLLQPRIFQHSVQVPGALVVLAALSGGVLFGIAGALIAIPTAASLLLLYREVLIPELDRR